GPGAALPRRTCRSRDLPYGKSSITHRGECMRSSAVALWSWLVLTLAVAALTPASAQAPLATVTVKIAGFRGVEGQALITLYDSEQSWLKVPKAVQVVRAKITGAAMTVELKDVKPGTYAVSVIHDE